MPKALVQYYMLQAGSEEYQKMLASDLDKTLRQIQPEPY